MRVAAVKGNGIAGLLAPLPFSMPLSESRAELAMSLR